MSEEIDCRTLYLEGQRESQFECSKIVQRQSGHICATNGKFFAVIVENSSGGAFQVFSLSKNGRFDADCGTVVAHESSLNDMKWDPFDDNVIATCSDDCKIRLFNIPDDGIPLRSKSTCYPCTCQLNVNCRVMLIQWNQNVKDMLASVGKDFKISLWNARNVECLSVFNCHHCDIYSLSFDKIGNSLATTAKDTKLRILNLKKTLDIRTAVCHDSLRPSTVIYLGSNNLLLTTGFCRNGSRQFALWNESNLSEPLMRNDIDHSSWPLQPFVDECFSLIYLVDKGGNCVKIYKLQHTHLYFVKELSTKSSHRALVALPKQICDLDKGEITKFIKVHSIQSVLELIDIKIHKTISIPNHVEQKKNALSVVVDCKSQIPNPIRRDVKNLHQQPSDNLLIRHETPASSKGYECKLRFTSQVYKANVPTENSCADGHLGDLFHNSSDSEDSTSSDDRTLLSDSDAKEEQLRGTGRVERADCRRFCSFSPLDVDCGRNEERVAKNSSSNERTESDQSNKRLDSESDPIGDRRPPQTNDDDGTRRSVNSIVRSSSSNIANKIRRLSQRSFSSAANEEAKSSKRSNSFFDTVRRSCSIRTRSASPMSPIRIRSCSEEVDDKKAPKPDQFVFNGFVRHKPPTKPGIIAPAPIVRRSLPHPEIKLRNCQSQPPTPRCDENRTSLQLDPQFAEKIFVHQTKTMRELFEENGDKDQRIECLDDQVAKLTRRLELLEDELKQKQDDVDSLRYEIVWKDRRVLQLEQQLYKYLAKESTVPT